MGTPRLSETAIVKAIRAARKEGGCVVEVRDDVIRVVPVEAEKATPNPVDLVDFG